MQSILDTGLKMKLSELKEGNLVFLEVVTKSKKLTFAVYVYSVIGDDLFLEVVRADDSNRYLALGPDSMSYETSYNLIYAKKDLRVEWKGLNLTTVTLKRGIYYKIEIKERNNVGNNADRRLNLRIDTENVFGTLFLYGNSYTVKIKDVGINDLSFIYEKSFDIVGETFDIRIKINMNDTEYDMNLQCICRRINRKDGKFVYGCEVSEEADKTYSYFVNSCRLVNLIELKEKMNDSITHQPLIVKKI